MECRTPCLLGFLHPVLLGDRGEVKQEVFELNLPRVLGVAAANLRSDLRQVVVLLSIPLVLPAKVFQPLQELRVGDTVPQFLNWDP